MVYLVNENNRIHALHTYPNYGYNIITIYYTYTTLTVYRDIVSKLPYIQATIRNSLQESAELGVVSVIRDLYCVTRIPTLM